MDVGTVELMLGNCATDDERRVLLELLQRQNAKAAVVVTVKDGGTKRRYVVSDEDADELRQHPGPVDEETRRYSRFWFGARWLRGFGRVDEMHRSIGMHDVLKVEEIDAKKVWGG